MSHWYTRRDYEAAAEYIAGRIPLRPQVGVILGSGLNPLAEAVESAHALDYTDIPGFPTPTVDGHEGRLIGGLLEGVPVWVMQGRVHYYEGYTMQQVAFPVRVMQVMGIQALLVTNAAGGLNPAFRVGDLMLIRDHINLMGMAGLSPLRGPNDPTLGPRFPDMSQAYDPRLRRLAWGVAEEHHIPIHEGVYVGLAGPSFETPADLRFLRLIGADAVGMSTVPEVTAARHGGMRVLGVSGISNVARMEAEPAGETSHEEVLAAGQQIVPRLTMLIRGILARWGAG